ncbi:MAG TPA: gephyrin-like molybdotransferase Glp [Gaiellales bacterium]|nr:gephyrin-like molybdotransferase Glp [Gaiellales bacterium]
MSSPPSSPPLLRPAEGLRLILEHAPALPVEEVAVSADLAGRVLAADVHAAVSLPPFDTSAMDGYTVRAADLRGGGVPIAFRLGAGDRPRPLPPGSAAGIATGAPLPEGADAVVPVEVAREEEGRLVADPPQVGAHIRERGGDVGEGDLVGAAGRRLTPALLAAISATGVGTVTVARRPRVAVLATGSELVRVGRPLEPGQIYESNMTSIVAQARSAGAEVVAASIVVDDREATREAFAGAIATADVVVSSGGVSVGPHDHVKPAMAALGVREVFWRLAHKPGKPLWFGVAENGALVFGLPGNPVSSLVCFELFLRPAFAALQHGHAPARPVARLAEPIERLRMRDHAVRCRLSASSDGMQLHPLGPQDSHLIVHAAGADAIALIDAGEGEAAAGDLVEYVPIR